ncbi:MAG: hypothetical protein ACFFB3_23295 [Candidatus Hodarchaeota archaeon]
MKIRKKGYNNQGNPPLDDLCRSLAFQTAAEEEKKRLQTGHSSSAESVLSKIYSNSFDFLYDRQKHPG